MQFALLGEMQFELITYFNGLDGRFAADFAEHARIGGKPRLQWTGDRLDEWSLKLRFHDGYCDPEDEVLKLRALLAEHKVLPFILANGQYKGEFVVAELSVVAEHTDADGRLVSADADLKLRESAPLLPRPAKPSGPAVCKLGQPVQAGVGQRVRFGGGAAALSPDKQAIGAAIRSARQLTDAAGAAHSALAAAQALASNPVGAVAQLTRARRDLEKLGESSGAMQSALGSVRSRLGEAAPLIQAATVASEEARNMRAELDGLTPANVAGRMARMQASMSRLDGAWGQTAAPLAGLAAHSQLRSASMGGA
ncbi:phage tail protein [Chromobacterium subtsugae]|uniref:phage tail protein n=1 Tax=Chromobacterium subtsugae TaxID=251747 RepID=UPI00069A6661|nr:phage tail protein [Chromobacterium subtsugae]